MGNTATIASAKPVNPSMPEIKLKDRSQAVKEALEAIYTSSVNQFSLPPFVVT